MGADAGNEGMRSRGCAAADDEEEPMHKEVQGSHPGAGDGNSIMALVAGYPGEESEQIKQESSSGTKHAGAQLECVQ